MKTQFCLLTLVLLLLVGCRSNNAELEHAQRDFRSTVAANIGRLQWELDQKTAARIFDNGAPSGTNRFLTFRKCHEEPPTHEKHIRVCANLEKLVADAEAKAQATAAKERSMW